MAKYLSVLRSTFRLELCKNQNLLSHISVLNLRNLYSDAFLGVDKFRDHSMRTTEEFGTMRGKQLF